MALVSLMALSTAASFSRAWRRQRDQRAAAVGGIGRPHDEPVALHARQGRRHRRLLDADGLRDLLLRERGLAESAKKTGR